MVVRPGFEPTMSMRESINAESANESSSAFEQDSFVLETKISRLEQEVTKSLNEIAKVFEMKYRDCVPQFLALADCQEKIDSSLYSANRKMENLQASLTTAEANMSQLADEDPTKKLIVVRGLINRLGVLDEMEKQLNALWLGASNGENRDCLTDATIITRLEEIVNSMENDEFSEAVNDRILPLIFSEIASRKSELEIVLEDFYKNFLQFPDVERVNPGTEEMVVTCPNPSLISDNLSAMNKLGSFSHKLGSFVEAVWKMFIMRIIQSTEPKSVVTYRCGEFNDIFTFSVTKPKSIATKREGKPADVFGALKEFFQNFHRALKHIHVSGTPFVAHFGKQVACRLVNSLVHDCFKPAIPSDAKDSGELKERTKHLYEDIVNHSSEFLKFMQDNHFFTETTVSFDDFLSDYERIFVDRRCQFFVSHARVLITQPYINLKEVGSCESEDEEKIGDIGRLMEERLKLNKESLETILRGPESDKYSTKLFQFQKCKVSTSTFDFVNLLQDILLEAAKAETEIESARLFTTARNLIEIFISLAPLHHQQAITTVPQIAAVFFNNCHYICHRLITIKADLQQTAADAAKQMNTD
ncbi:centromere/kinetochore zw10 domain-containing protein [Ditylenchus destructor]|uniref:Centromere/kinetochore zw10 domain-containing protein n=1 Tax=Ditylenchus destructor TaxID=166010 RepID=A0AAD4R9I8_9BILA|nr:centromere/kinetochore zw10 domain-containing protein [Ditylenchus destructor]